ncbi:MAG: hypothetical protein VYA60_04415 [Pseudomonadota bacterium]|nr:hypothetical protein [Pseudomonadota bacterium]
MSDSYSGTISEFLAHLDPTIVKASYAPRATELASAIAEPLFYQYRQKKQDVNTDVFVDHIDLDSIQNALVDYDYGVKGITDQLHYFMESIPDYQEAQPYNKQSSAFNEAYGYIVMALIQMLETLPSSSNSDEAHESA